MIRNDLKSVVKSKLNEFKTGMIEHVWCEVQTEQDDKLAVVGCIYRPPNSKEEDDIRLIELINYVENECKNQQILVMGDFNYPGIDWSSASTNGSNSQEDFLEAIQNVFWTQHVHGGY